jgi:hypothetical protein
MTSHRNRMMRAAVVFAALSLVTLAQTSTPRAQTMSEQDAYAIARDAYVYAYPIVSMQVTRQQVTNVPDATSVSLRAPVNQFAHARTYPKADARDVVRFNTLYSFAWLDLAPEPIILSVPDMGGRYFMLPMLDMWTDVFCVVGSRTTGAKAGNYAIVAPGWTGTLPDGVDKIITPTPAIWILGRTQTNGPVDYENVHKVQDGYKLTPLSQWGKGYTPPGSMPTDASVDNTTPPFKQVNAMDGVTMLGRLASLMGKYPPHANDYPILFRMRQIGLKPSKPFDASKLDPALVKTINTAASDALKDIEQAGKTGEGLTKVNGWFYTAQTVGTYGTAYHQRAMATFIGLGVNLPEDAVYATTFMESDGKPYSGANRYVLHFDKGKFPPAGAFWSVTLYDPDGYQVPNPLDRYALGDRDKLTFNADGSLDLYVQNESPGADKEANWLPTPKGAFDLTMRIYSPRPDLVNGTWVPPPVK